MAPNISQEIGQFVIGAQLGLARDGFDVEIKGQASKGGIQPEEN